MNDIEERSSDLLGMTTDIVAAYVTKNAVRAEDVAALITSVHAALNTASAPAVEGDQVEEIEKPTAAAIRKSITSDYLISFEDGKRYKSMKRSLSLKGLTPVQYREKWGLPKDYPMVAPGYSAARSELAKAMGLGAGGRKAAAKAPAKARAPKAK